MAVPPPEGPLPPPPARCWCGDLAPAPWSPDYLRCPACGTLVAAAPPDPGVSRVEDEGTSLYGLGYFDEHARALGHPTLRERARLDLPERCAFWLEALLRLRPPPARTLELGCASGAFVALLAAAGYAATGLDLSPAVTAFARETFQVPVLTGPLEAQALPPGSLDVVILMDVLEHLPQPLATLEAVARLLAPGGLVLIQTPRHDPSRSFAALRAGGDPFLAQLKPAEHLFLFSTGGAATLLARAGLPHLEFLPAIFAAYDMSFAAAAAPLRMLPPQAGRDALRRTPGGRVVEAMLDAAARAARLEDRAARLEAQVAEGARGQARLTAELRAAAAQAADREAELLRLREVAAAHGELLRRLGFLARLFGAARPGLDA